MSKNKKPKANENKLQIRNSTVDFLVFTKDSHEEGIEVRVQNHDVWLTQKAIGQLFDVDRSVVTKHLKNIYESGELDESTTCANFAQVADNGRTIRPVCACVLAFKSRYTLKVAFLRFCGIM